MTITEELVIIIGNMRLRALKRNRRNKKQSKGYASETS